MNEFELIANYFAPLAGPQGLSLMDDAALWTPPPGRDLVISADTMTEGVHFPRGQFDGRLGQKLLRVNISDLIAKSARPEGYLLSLAMPAGVAPARIKDFCAGLAIDQNIYGLTLWGGDTVTGCQDLTLSVTVIGSAPSGAMVRRSGAKIGDEVIVTGTIGDGWLGLRAMRGEKIAEAELARAAYYLPQPPYAARRLIRRFASASADVSDGLIADGAAIARASGLGMCIRLENVPLSDAGKHWLKAGADAPSRLAQLASGGDDYQTILTVPRERSADFIDAAKEAGIGAVIIGSMTRTQTIECRYQDQPVPIKHSGFTHQLAANAALSRRR